MPIAAFATKAKKIKPGFFSTGKKKAAREPTPARKVAKAKPNVCGFCGEPPGHTGTVALRGLDNRPAWVHLAIGVGKNALFQACQSGFMQRLKEDQLQRNKEKVNDQLLEAAIRQHGERKEWPPQVSAAVPERKDSPQPTLFYCREGECDRVYDREKGLQLHHRREHK